MTNISSTKQRELEGVAINIVHQIGGALYDALPKDIAHEYFVDARQATNDLLINFTAKLINQYTANAVVEARIDETSTSDSPQAWKDFRIAELLAQHEEYPDWTTD